MNTQQRNRQCKRVFSKYLFLLSVFSTTGCAILSTHQAKLDQMQLRDTLMDYVDAQIMDNLIRAKNGLPIVHYDFSHVGGVVADKLPVTVAAGQTLTHTANTSAAGLLTSGVQMAMRPFTFSTTPERDNTIDVEVLPITAEKQIYASYIEFLSAEPDGKRKSRKGTVDSLVTTTVTTTAPAAGKQPDTTTTTLKKDSDGNPQIISTTSVGSLDKVDKKPEKKIEQKTTEVTTTTRSGTVDFTVNFDKIQSVRQSPTPPENPDDVLFGARQWQNGSFRYVAKRWKDGNYYWIPKEYKAAFFKLCVATVARGYASPASVPSPASASGATAPSAPVTIPGGPAGNSRTPQQLFEDFGSTLRQLQNK